MFYSPMLHVVSEREANWAEFKTNDTKANVQVKYFMAFMHDLRTVIKHSRSLPEFTFSMLQSPSSRRCVLTSKKSELAVIHNMAL